MNATETAEEEPAQARTGASTPTKDDEAVRIPPRAVLRRRKTEPRLPRQLEKGGSQLHPEQELLHQRIPLAGVRVQ